MKTDSQDRRNSYNEFTKQLSTALSSNAFIFRFMGIGIFLCWFLECYSHVFSSACFMALRKSHSSLILRTSCFESYYACKTYLPIW